MTHGPVAGEGFGAGLPPTSRPHTDRYALGK